MIENLCGNAIDWDATGSMLSGIGTIAGSITVLVTARLARSTFNDWKKQKLAERHMDHAEAILAATYQVRANYRSVRMAWMPNSELEQAAAELERTGELAGLTKDKRDKLVQVHAIILRINKTVPAREALENIYPIAKAYWGDDLEIKLRELSNCSTDLYIAASRLAHQTDQTPTEDVERVHKTLYATGNDDGDEFAQRVNALIADIEAVCLPALRTGKLSSRNPQ
jgi:hypothetical protein